MERLDEFGQPEITSDERTFGMLTHLSALLGFFFPFGAIIGPLVAWSIKKNDSAFVDENGKAALNFHITWTIVLAVLWILWLVQFLGSIPFLVILESGDIDTYDAFPVKLLLGSFIYFIPIAVIYLMRFIFMLVGTITASNGKVYHYPAAYRFIK
jgi:uncharacterized Tic20 family protein